MLENVREILEAEAVKQKFTKVNKITLEIGKLSCVAPDALRFGFDVVMKDSLAENAELVITELEGRGLCQQCGQQTDMETLCDPCTACGSIKLDILQGLEMKIKEMVVI